MRTIFTAVALLALAISRHHTEAAKVQDRHVHGW